MDSKQQSNWSEMMLCVGRKITTDGVIRRGLWERDVEQTPNDVGEQALRSCKGRGEAGKCKGAQIYGDFG